MQNEIKVLKDKVERLNDEMKTLDRLNTERAIENLNIKFKLETCESGVVTIIESWESKLYQCESGNQNGVISRKELELCRKELSDEQNSKDRLNQTLQSIEKSLNVMQDKNDELQNQLTSEKAENENLQNEIQQLKSEKIKLQSESSRRQEELKKELDFEKTTNSATIQNLNNYISRFTNDIKVLKNDKETGKFYF